jgi:FeS assembly SUF system protein
MSESTAETLHDRVVAALRGVHDPEIPVNIYDLGLIYRLDIDDEQRARIEMTLTAPNCPIADQIVADVRRAVSNVDGISSADVQLVWQPAWSPDRMSEIARLELEALGIDPRRAAESAANRPTSLTIRGQGTKKT